jgi:nucleoside-triphosphatase
MTMPPPILITGNPGSGKSTLMARLIEDIGEGQIAGLGTPEIRRRNARIGFKLIDLATGEEEILASTSGKGPTVGKYHVDVEAIDRIVAKIETSLPSARFIFIDEIGKMELFSQRFKEFVDRVFSLGKPVIAVVHRNLVRNYEDKGRLLLLTRSNFEKVRAEILADLKSCRY